MLQIRKPLKYSKQVYMNLTLHEAPKTPSNSGVEAPTHRVNVLYGCFQVKLNQKGYLGRRSK